MPESLYFRARAGKLPWERPTPAGRVRPTSPMPDSASPPSPDFLLVEGIPLSPAQASAIRADLLALLADGVESADAGERVVAQGGYLRTLVPFLREARKAAGAEWGESPEANEEGLGVFRDGMGRDGWARLLRTARRPAATGKLRVASLGLAFSVAALARRDSRSRFDGWRAVAAYLGAGFGLGGARAPSGAIVPWRELARARLEPLSDADEAFRAAAARWIENEFASGPAADPELRHAHDELLLRFGAAADLARAAAVESNAEGGPLEVSGDAARAALDRAERDFGPDGPWRPYLRRVPKIRQLVDSLYMRPTFPHAMGRAD